MEKIIGLSAVTISFAILVIGGVLFAHFIHDNLGGMLFIFSLMGFVFSAILLVATILKVDQQ